MLKLSTFGAGELPHAKFDVDAPGGEGLYTWSLLDGDLRVEGTFEVQSNKPGRFGKALKENRNIIIGE